MSLANELGMIEKLQCISEETKRKAMVEIIDRHRKTGMNGRPICPMFNDVLAGKTTLAEQWQKLGKSIFRQSGIFPNILSGFDTEDEVNLIDKAIEAYRNKEEASDA